MLRQPARIQLFALVSAIMLAACQDAPIPVEPTPGSLAFVKGRQSELVADAIPHPGIVPESAPVLSNCSPPAGAMGEYVVLYFRTEACRTGLTVPMVQPTGSSLVLRVTDIRPGLKKGKVPTITFVWGVFAVDDATGTMYGTDHFDVGPTIPDAVNGFVLHVDQDNLPIYVMDPDTRVRIPPAIGTISLGDVIYTPR